MAQIPRFDLEQFAGCSTGLAAFCGKNIEKLLTSSLAHWTLMEEPESLSKKLNSLKGETGRENLKQVMKFVRFVQEGRNLDETLLEYRPLVDYIRQSLEIAKIAAVELKGVKLPELEGVESLGAMPTSEQERKRVLHDIAILHICKSNLTIGPLMTAFEKGADLTLPLKNFLSCKIIVENEASAKARDLHNLIREGSSLCLQKNNMEDDAVEYLENLRIGNLTLNAALASINPEEISRSIRKERELLMIRVTELHLKQKRWKDLYDELLQICHARDQPLHKFIKALNHHHQTRTALVFPNGITADSIKTIATQLQLDSIYEDTQQYFGDVASSNTDAELFKRIKPDEETSGILRKIARYDLLCNIMLRIIKIDSSVLVSTWTELQSQFFAVQNAVCKLSQNRNRRLHYNQSDDPGKLDQNEVKELYEFIVNSEFFRSAYNYLSNDAFDEVKEQYFTFEDIGSVNEILNTCVYRLSSPFDIEDDEYESLETLRVICEQKRDSFENDWPNVRNCKRGIVSFADLGPSHDDYWRAADSDLSTKMLAYYSTEPNIVTGEIQPHIKGDVTWRALSSSRLAADVFGEVMKSKKDTVPKSLLKRLAVRKVARGKVKYAELYRAFYTNIYPDVPVSLEYPGFKSIPGRPYLGGTPDAVLDINGKKVLLIFYNMRNNKKAAKSKALQNENLPYVLDCEDPKGHSLYHESIGLAKAHGIATCHVVIFGKCDCPNGECMPSPECLAVVEVNADLTYFDTNMAQKLRQFYFSVLLPELASPRKAKGFRKEPFEGWNQLFPQQNNEP